MDIQNDTRYSVQTLPATGPDDKPVLVIVVKGTFDIKQDKSAVESAKQMPVGFGDELYDPENGGSVKFESDIATFKPRTDVAVVGRAYVPGGKADTSVDVSIRVGSLRKQLHVSGDRNWQCLTSYIPATISKPEPFRVMDLIYENAFGGIDKIAGGYCAGNVIGKGYYVKKSKKGLHGMPLPNIEDPGNLISSWDDHPEPQGFGFLAKGWEPRLGYMGTYDETWQKERAPKPPLDFRYDFNNAAHPGMQVNEYLSGDEGVEMENLTNNGHLSFKLPGTKIHCTAVKSYKLMKMVKTGGTALPKDAHDEERPESIVMNLDTLCLIPDEMKLYAVWRGLCPVVDMTGLEVIKLQIKERR